MISIFIKKFIFINVIFKTNIQLTNEFATAAFRYGHSTVQDSYQRFTPSNVLIDELKFSDINFKSDEAYKYDFNSHSNVFN